MTASHSRSKRGGMLRARAPAGPKGQRAYVVGDVHGRLDLLEEMLERIEDDVRNRKRATTTIIFLGDYVDRGPQSAEVVERLCTFRPDFARVLCIMGNHEEVMLRVLRGEFDLFVDWLRFGGAECLRSYGLDPVQLRRTRPARALELIAQAIPDHHVDFLKNCVDSVSFGSYLLVHAGIRPGVALADQTQRDMRWIRQPFLDDERDFGQVIVHGHTIVPEVEQRSNRIALDTGAYRTGLLSALALEEGERWLIQTGRSPEPGRAASKGEALQPAIDVQE
jgi:serine/threonine protein phosphatase 1